MDVVALLVDEAEERKKPNRSEEPPPYRVRKDDDLEDLTVEEVTLTSPCKAKDLDHRRVRRFIEDNPEMKRSLGLRTVRRQIVVKLNPFLNRLGTFLGKSFQIPPEPNHLPEQLSVEAFFNLNGTYLLSEVVKSPQFPWDYAKSYKEIHKVKDQLSVLRWEGPLIINIKELFAMFLHVEKEIPIEETRRYLGLS